MNEADAVAVRLDATGVDLEDPSAVARQVPEAAGVAPRTKVVVLATGLRSDGVLRRLLGPRAVAVSSASRCTALLTRGYVDLGADAESAWGRAP